MFESPRGHARGRQKSCVSKIFGALFFSARVWGLLIDLPFFGVISKLLIEVIGLRGESRGRLFANRFGGKRSAVLDFSLNLLIRVWGYMGPC